MWTQKFEIDTIDIGDTKNPHIIKINFFFMHSDGRRLAVVVRGDNLTIYNEVVGYEVRWSVAPYIPLEIINMLNHELY